MYYLYRWNSVDQFWSYCNAFRTYSDAVDERERLHRRHGGDYAIRWEEI